MSRQYFWVQALSALVFMCFTHVALAETPGAALARLVGEGAVISDTGGRVEMRVEMSQPVPWRVHTLDGPPRLIVDFAELVWESDPDIQSGSVLDVNSGAFRPGWSRTVVVLREPLAVDAAEMQVMPDGTAVLALQLLPTTAEAFREQVGIDPVEIEPVIVAPPPASGVLRVALDPGHGGIDPGAEDGDLQEADLMLAFARELKEALLRTGRFEVVMTRERDVFVPLSARMTRARSAGADVFLSLHADSLDEDNGVASGMTVYTLAENVTDAAALRLAERHAQNDILAGVDLAGVEDEISVVLMDLARRETSPRSEALAEMIVAGFRSHELAVNSNPHRSGGFTVLKAAEVPSVLIELGFLSSERDRALLLSQEWSARASEAVRDALLQWADEDYLMRQGLRQ
ncbi:MAG: N-acetylmuramoyl-L-alanine amidase [Boseongicola sp.]|nr:N-acetylmuramoyl-L-alanine amidase [Boseongicola sp.]NNJ66464.1 N-acetylmuramoyl-L-alanine amidase [Boseongicola sp.]